MCRNPDRSTSPHSCPRHGTSGCRPALQSPSILERERERKISEDRGFKLNVFFFAFFRLFSIGDLRRCNIIQYSTLCLFGCLKLVKKMPLQLKTLVHQQVMPFYNFFFVFSLFVTAGSSQLCTEST